MSINSFGARRSLDVDGQSYEIYDIDAVPGSSDLPYSLKVLLENLLRTEDGANITADQITALGQWDATAQPSHEIQFTPARVIMQDFTGVPCIVDLATMREAIADLGGDPNKVNPLSPAEMVIDHSVIVEKFGVPDALQANMGIEYDRNRERYQFLRWGQTAFENFRVVPPGTGIVHQVNLEHLARVTFVREEDGTRIAYPDTCVGTDSHTTMVNGLGVVGWGVGGIEAEAAMLGQPVSMLVPRVVGFKLSGELPEGVTATDLVLRITQMLREHRVVGKFVEFYGSGVSAVPLANRATLGNMSPEYGSTVAIFPVDDVTLDYLRLTGRDEHQIKLIEAYTKAQGMWHDPSHEARYSEYLELDLSTVTPAIAGPKRPQDRIELTEAKESFEGLVPSYTSNPGVKVPVTLSDGRSFELANGAVTVAAITSCTNTSNPSVMIAAGLVAKKAHELGLKPKPWVKTSLAPGSQVVTDYFNRAGLAQHLSTVGFDLVGYGCTTCIGNTGPLIPEVSTAINDKDLAVTAVLSGNRNFEGRISPDVKMNYLASPPLVVIYALAGTMDIDLATEPVAVTDGGKEVFLTDLWPSAAEIAEIVNSSISAQMYTERYADVFDGGERWKSLETPEGDTFAWDADSTYVRKLPIFDGMAASPEPMHDIHDARVLLKLGDSVTTDHISPAGAIKPDSPAGLWLAEQGVQRKDFNSYGSRRGNHEVMMRGTFANIRLRNQLAPGTEGGFTRDFTVADGPVSTIYDAAVNYRAANTPLVVLGGKEYGSGSSRDWAAKGTMLLGVKVVIAESYERIHRSNLIGMGVLPLQFPEGVSADSLGLSGEETFDFEGIEQINETIPPTIHVTATRDGRTTEFDVVVRIDTPGEREYYLNGGILQYVLRRMAG
ncbi:Aconitate hydratase [Cutibacterium granulosum]|uniref:Aconitate hydratase n=2 Tax=Cutibacterium granulosum TaxID=33011 RepID=U1GJL3_9ACTN|nr:aconitate hydratase AcnA [Cutibacterium granulosum]MBX7471691.1 aconitate hydratase AcnA [Streptomyces sp. MAG02]ERF58295.1 aconitate hydratase [Cutibacterium granulosum DSM 20700]KAG9059703.1 aconitate hydratase AcnA [Cutibacterium granulosum DSM 20700]MDU3767741.1 aconitate hydratase AcnA [Cutibacterium granulosum]MDU3821616.1 aconitate hydratase AcnA [Cutibacterium granulosum]